MKNLSLLLFVFTLFFSCSNPCEEVACGAFGSCDEGTCICDDGAYGENCDQFYRDDFIGDWSTVTHSCDVGNSLPSIYTFSNGTNITEIEIRSSITPDFLLIAKVDKESLIIENQVLEFGIPVTHSGSAKLGSDNTMELTIVQEAENQPVRTCNYLIQK